MLIQLHLTVHCHKGWRCLKSRELLNRWINFGLSAVVYRQSDLPEQYCSFITSHILSSCPVVSTSNMIEVAL